MNLILNIISIKFQVLRLKIISFNEIQEICYLKKRTPTISNCLEPRVPTKIESKRNFVKEECPTYSAYICFVITIPVPLCHNKRNCWWMGGNLDENNKNLCAGWKVWHKFYSRAIPFCLGLVLKNYCHGASMLAWSLPGWCNHKRVTWELSGGN